MQSSATDRSAPGDRRLAVWAEALYLVNLLPAPVLGFGLLLWLFLTRGPTASPLAACHLRQAVAASIWAGILIGAAALLIVGVGGFDRPATWVLLILYITCVHSMFILFGVIGLTRAMAGQPFRYPLIGPRCGEK
ncbi:hypothetical protein AN478_06610 [Thiohalorhabdus denitrificans]|uniref:Uncharacterized protein n=1 Tax=Thiohalorhabdus denitrificans TaxID=381306 RepID=A0A0P9C6K0_9GAMM|nr:hypothetical protein [Thiohalorhabdus denitrificans]KPV40458.1 hypothetical protein AN478_06610 [Thiohalorhabdus denitrificans]SCY61361.1 hypothetical protein SAMN05661077_2685 [Thiohalorhabdus denitrificans]